MRFSLILMFFFFSRSSCFSSLVAPDSSHRRILHQPLFPVSTSPPPDITYASPPPPAPVAPAFPSPDQPFFPEVPSTASSAQAQPPPPVAVSSNGRIPMATAAETARPVKKVAIAVSVGIVTLGMLSAFAFFLYRHRVKHQAEGQKLVGAGESHRFQEDSSVPPSNFLYIGTVEPSRTAVSEPNEANDSPYHKLNSVKRSDRHRPSPELHPLPPLPKPPPAENWPAAMSASSSDEESHGTAFYTPQGSTVSTEDSFHSSISRSVNRIGGSGSVPRSKRTSPKSRISVASPEMKHVIIPSIKPQVPPHPPAMPKLSNHEDQLQNSPEEVVSASKRAKFSAPPPPPNMELLRAISSSSPQRKNAPPPPPPPPPPPHAPPVAPTPKKGSGLNGVSSIPSQSLKKAESVRTPSPRRSPDNRLPRKSSEGIQSNNVISSERSNGDETEGSKPRLKPLHWDKVRATSDRATVWDQLKSSSFQLNEDMMESLFGCNPTNTVPKEPTRRSVLPPVEKENRVLDPKKSQNIAIQLRALNVTREEVSEALLDGNPDSLGADLLEKLVKMAPTKEEEIKLREYKGDVSKLGSAERFLKSVLDIPFAFKRVEALLYRGNFEAEVKYLRKAFQTLEVASEELKNSRLFLKLLEAVLRTGNRMNVGTNRGDAKAFKLETLLKLVDIKGTDGKTTLLHFVVQEIIRSEGADVSGSNGGTENISIPNMKESEFKKQGLQVVAGLSRDLSNVKKAAAMDSDVLSSYVSKLEKGLDTVRSALQIESSELQGKFFQSMKHFMKDAEEEIVRVKGDERKALSLVKEVTEYFHGDAAKEEAHPLRIFMIVRDFLSILDHVCKDVGQMQDRTMIGSARSFRISATASLPVLNRYNARQDSSDEDSSSP